MAFGHPIQCDASIDIHTHGMVDITGLGPCPSPLHSPHEVITCTPGYLKRNFLDTPMDLEGAVMLLVFFHEEMMAHLCWVEMVPMSYKMSIPLSEFRVCANFLSIARMVMCSWLHMQYI